MTNAAGHGLSSKNKAAAFFGYGPSQGGNALKKSGDENLDEVVPRLKPGIVLKGGAKVPRQ